MYVVLTAVLLWIDRYSNQQVQVFCDNQSVVAMINNSTSSCRRCMVLIRILVFHCLKVNVRVFAKYVDTKSNERADWLSRGKVDLFKAKYQHDEQPANMPEEIWPIEKVW